MSKLNILNMLLDFKKSKKLLDKYNILVVKTRIIKTKKQAINFTKKNNWPVVLKVNAPSLLHKTEKGLVKTGIKNKQELIKEFKSIFKKSKNIKNKEILIQKTIKGVEIICGMKRDPAFGPVLMFGLGGIFTEVLKDISFQISPVSKKEAKEMIKKIKGYKILKGYRNTPKADINKLTKLILNISKLSQENPQIKEIDLNPVFVNEKEIKVVDPKIII